MKQTCMTETLREIVTGSEVREEEGMLERNLEDWVRFVLYRALFHVLLWLLTSKRLPSNSKLNKNLYVS